MNTKFLKTKETEKGKFYYTDFGSERHGRTSFRLWVHPSLIKRNENNEPYIEFPLENASLITGKSEYTIILRPGDCNLFDLFVPCGYRGGASINVITPYESEFPYYAYKSPTGSLGVSVGELVITEEDHVTYEWKRTGRLYGAEPKGTTTIFLDGREENFEETDLCEIEDLAEV